MKQCLERDPTKRPSAKEADEISQSSVKMAAGACHQQVDQEEVKRELLRLLGLSAITLPSWQSGCELPRFAFCVERFAPLKGG